MFTRSIATKFLNLILSKEEENNEQQPNKINQILGMQEIEQQEEKSLIVLDKRKNIFSKMCKIYSTFCYLCITITSVN